MYHQTSFYHKQVKLSTINAKILSLSVVLSLEVATMLSDFSFGSVSPPTRAYSTSMVLNNSFEKLIFFVHHKRMTRGKILSYIFIFFRNLLPVLFNFKFFQQPCGIKENVERIYKITCAAFSKASARERSPTEQ